MSNPAAHFAAGLIGGTLVAGPVVLLRKRWRRYVPVFAGLCGLWAWIPDFPRSVRVVERLLLERGFVRLANWPVIEYLGRHRLGSSLTSYGDWFFLHRLMDTQYRIEGLAGLVVIVLYYHAVVLAYLLAIRSGGRGLKRLMAFFLLYDVAVFGILFATRHRIGDLERLVTILLCFNAAILVCLKLMKWAEERAGTLATAPGEIGLGATSADIG